MANLRRKGAKNSLGKDPKRAEQRAAQLAAIDPDWDCPWPLDWQRHDRLLSGLVADEPDGVLPRTSHLPYYGRRRHRQVAPTAESAGRLGVAPALARRAWTGHGRRPQALTVWGTSGWLTGEVVPDDDKRTAELLAGCGGQKLLRPSRRPSSGGGGRSTRRDWRCGASRAAVSERPPPPTSAGAWSKLLEVPHTIVTAFRFPLPDGTRIF
ncbi:hypothetical protein [Streptomyces achromogenes]|uniref:hypothetical protein n=1 Tax=Streptomyces achromogenes TaxID=67255 RepID=UPI0036A01A17